MDDPIQSNFDFKTNAPLLSLSRSLARSLAIHRRTRISARTRQRTVDHAAPPPPGWAAGVLTRSLTRRTHSSPTPRRRRFYRTPSSPRVFARSPHAAATIGHSPQRNAQQPHHRRCAVLVCARPGGKRAEKRRARAASGSTSKHGRRDPDAGGAPGARGGGPRRDAVRGAAEAGLLRGGVPRCGEHRARRRVQEGPGDAHRRRRHAPPLLPRLLRRGVRRVGDPGVDGEQHGGEGPPEQPLPRRRRLRHGHQGQGGRRRRAAVHEPGLVRGHPHHGHPRRHCAGRRTVVRRGAREAGRAELDFDRRRREAAAAVLQPGPADGDIRREQPVADRHDRFIRGAHGRVRALQHVLVADPAGVGGPDAGRQLRGGAAVGVPRRRGPQHRAGDRPHHAARLRQPVLRQPGAGAGALHLRPGALLRRPVPPHRRRLVAEQLRLRAGVRRCHDQPRPRRRQDRPVAGEHTPGLRLPQQLNELKRGSSGRLLSRLNCS